jgi:hypothetical protein
MLKTALKSKWWWWIPILSIFYIEQQAAWVDSEDGGGYKLKYMLFLLNILYHFIFVSYALYLIISKYN